MQASDVAANAVNTGDTAPDCTLPNATGQHVNLHGTLSRGPVILSFYRSGWCPFCNLELQALKQLKVLGANAATGIMSWKH